MVMIVDVVMELNLEAFEIIRLGLLSGVRDDKSCRCMSFQDPRGKERSYWALLPSQLTTFPTHTPNLTGKGNKEKLTSH